MEKLQENHDCLRILKLSHRLREEKKHEGVFSLLKKRYLSAFIPFVYLTCETRYLGAGGPLFMRPFEPKIAEEVGTKVQPRKNTGYVTAIKFCAD